MQPAKSFKVCGISNRLDGLEDHLVRKKLQQVAAEMSQDQEDFEDPNLN